jgi:formylmethanofuran dehydrogenase subunit D
MVVDKTLTRINAVLITGRVLRQGQSKEVGKKSQMYQENVAICELDPEDLKNLKISPGTNVSVSTKHGDVVVKGLLSTQAPHKGIVFIPCGPWANMIIGSETNGTGMPSYKGVKAEVTPAPNEIVLDVTQLLKKIIAG